MAVTKSKSYTTSSSVKNAAWYIMNDKKTSADIASTSTNSAKNIENVDDDLGDGVIKNAASYAVNNQKTALINSDGTKEVFVSGHRCKPDLVEEVFKRTRDTYYRNGHNEHVNKSYQVKTLFRPLLDENGKPVLDANGQMIHDVTEKSPVLHDEEGNPVFFTETRYTEARVCYMWVMAFPPESVLGYKIDPHIVHQIGREFCEGLEEITGLEFPCVVATHLNTAHLHNHIIQSAYALDGHHKYRDTMDMLNSMRELSDRLSLKYGLPIIVEPENDHSRNYSEWKLSKEGKSWKDLIKSDIEYCVEKATDYEDYIKRMKSLGYELRETENSITYYTPDKKHRCRDAGFGSKYTKNKLVEYFSTVEFTNKEKDLGKPLEDVNVVDPALIESKGHTHKIYVSMYTESGRRRSKLELLILKAIRIIQLFKDKFSHIDDASPNPVNRSANWKVARLCETIEILNSFNISTVEELENKLNEIGVQHSHLKKECAALEDNEANIQCMLDILSNVQDLKEFADRKGITSLYLTPPDDKQMAEAQAKAFPMSAKERKELFTLMQAHSLYRVPKYDSISHSEFEEIKSYLSGKVTTKPAKLMTLQEFDNHRLRAKYQAIADKTIQSNKEKLGSMAVPDALADKIAALNLPVSVSELSFADALHLMSYFGQYTLKFKPATDTDIPVTSGRAEQIKELLALRKKKINIPVESLKQSDATRLFNNLLLEGTVPKSLSDINNHEWDDSIRNLTYEERGYADEYRNAVNQLSMLGYDVNHINTVINDLKYELNSISAAKAELKNLADEYKTLKQVRRYIDMAGNVKFTHGPKWTPSLEINTEEIEVEHVEDIPDGGKQEIENKDYIEIDLGKRTSYSEDIDI